MGHSRPGRCFRGERAQQYVVRLCNDTVRVEKGVFNGPHNVWVVGLTIGQIIERQTAASRAISLDIVNTINAWCLMSVSYIADEMNADSAAAAAAMFIDAVIVTRYFSYIAHAAFELSPTGTGHLFPSFTLLHQTNQACLFTG